MKLIKYAISFFLFFSFPINVFAVVFVEQYQESYCDVAGCYAVECTQPWIEYIDFGGTFIRFQDIGSDFLNVKCDLLPGAPVYYPYPGQPAQNWYWGGVGSEGSSGEFFVCEPTVQTYQTSCGTQASPYSFADGGSAFPVDPLAETWKPGMWQKTYWVYSALGCGSVYTFITRDDPEIPDNIDIVTCPSMIQAEFFWFDLSSSIVDGTGFKCSYSYAGGAPFTSLNMTPCGYCYNTCSSDTQHLDPVTCQCSYPDCPVGQKWSEIEGACIIDPCPPPMFDTGGGVCDINCSQIKVGLNCQTCAEADPLLPLWDPITFQCVAEVANCTDVLGQGWMFDYLGVCAQCSEVVFSNDPRPPESYAFIAVYPDVDMSYTYDSQVTAYGNKFLNDAFDYPTIPFYTWPTGIYSRDIASQLNNCSEYYRPFTGPYDYSDVNNTTVDTWIYDGLHGRFIAVPLTPGLHNFSTAVSFVPVPGLDLITGYYGYSLDECEQVLTDLMSLDYQPNFNSFDFDSTGLFEVCSQAWVYHGSCGTTVKLDERCVTSGGSLFSTKGRGSKSKGNKRVELLHKHIGRGGYERIQ